MITDRLAARPYRGPDYKAENAALVELVGCLANQPDAVLKRLVQRIMDLTHAHSVGVSISEPAPADPAHDRDGPDAVFRWRAIVGSWARYEGGTLPRHDSPCGSVLARAAPMLIHHPERHWAFPPAMGPAIIEAILVPFGVRSGQGDSGQLVGTVWALTHDMGKQFDREDLRLMESLANFAGAAYQYLTPRA